MIKKCLTYLVTNLLLLLNFYGEIPQDMNIEYKENCDIQRLKDFHWKGLTGEYIDSENDLDYIITIDPEKKELFFLDPYDRTSIDICGIKYLYFQIDWKEKTISFYKNNKSFIISFVFLDYNQFKIKEITNWLKNLDFDEFGDLRNAHKLPKENIKRQIVDEHNAISYFSQGDYWMIDRIYIDPFAKKK